MGMNAPIGVFDSGVGGLTVAREIMRQLPDERMVYFGDTARLPYGSKSKETIIRFSRQIIRFLKTKEVKAIVVACNTATAYALEEIQKESEVPVIGVIDAAARVASSVTRNGQIGVIDMLLKAGLCASKSEARRLITQGGVFVGDKKVPAVEETVAEDAFGDDGIIVKKGKKTYHKFTKA